MWLILATFAAAQDGPIDLDDALALALRDGVDAQEAAFARQAAESTLARRRQAGLPSLNLGASAGVAVTGAGASPTASLSATSVTPLYAGGAIASAREAALADLDAARAAEARTRQDLHLALAQALLSLADARAREASAASTLTAEEALATRIETLVAAGARTRADQLQQAATVARARSTRIDAARDAMQAELTLDAMLRLDPGRSWAFRPPEVGPEVAGDYEALVAIASGGRPEIVAAKAALAAAEADLRGAGASGRPTLDLVLGASTKVAGAGDAGAQLGDNAGGSAVLQASVPLFNRGATRDDVTQARLARDEAALALAAAEEAAAYDVRGAQVDRDAAGAAAEAAEARWRAADAAARVVADRYDAGAATFAELLAARADLADAERERITAHTRLQAARYALAWAVGAL